MMIVMIHLDFYRVLSHYRRVETRHPLRLGVPLNRTPNGLSLVQTAVRLWEISGDATSVLFSTTPNQWVFNETGAVP